MVLFEDEFFLNLYMVALIRLTGIENGLLGLNSRVNAVMWAKTSDELDIDVICFGHLLFEMCAGYELTEMHPTKGHLQLDLERYPGVIEILNLIFDYPDGGYPSIEELVLHEFFRNIDLREMRGMGVSRAERFFLFHRFCNDICLLPARVHSCPQFHSSDQCNAQTTGRRWRHVQC